MLGMKTETRRGLVAAGAALIALITLAILSPTPQLYIWYTTQNGLVTLGVTYFVYDLYSDYGGPGLYLFCYFYTRTFDECRINTYFWGRRRYYNSCGIGY